VQSGPGPQAFVVARQRLEAIEASVEKGVEIDNVLGRDLEKPRRVAAPPSIEGGAAMAMIVDAASKPVANSEPRTPNPNPNPNPEREHEPSTENREA
jgi:hypothetical protein